MDSSNNDQTRPMNLGEETQPMPVNPQAELPPDLGDTVAIPVDSTPPTPPNPPEALHENPRPSRLWRWAIPVALLGLVAIAALSAVAGYASGIDRRTSHEATQVANAVAEQFNLGVQDLEAKRFELARQRFEYVIQLDPAYPGVTDKLSLVLLELNTTATPTTVPTPTLTPTVDLRSAEELYSQAQVLLADGKWTEAIDTLLRLRKNEPNYQAIKVDSMLFVALRNRGIDRILKDGDLEGGTYDLAVAERFGPLDVEADNMRTWADLYATGASYWGLDWPKVLEYFSQIIQLAPNLRDSTNMTATERYRVASIRYGDFLASNGDWCSALEQYQAAFEMGSDPSVEPTASWVGNKCEEDQKEDKGGDEEPTETPPTEGTPSPETPTEPPPTEETPTPETPQPTEPYP